MTDGGRCANCGELDLRKEDRRLVDNGPCLRCGHAPAAHAVGVTTICDPPIVHRPCEFCRVEGCFNYVPQPPAVQQPCDMPRGER